MGRCVPGELIIEGLGTIVSFQQTDPLLRNTGFLRFLFAAVTLIPGVIFSIVAYRRYFYPSSTSDQLDMPKMEGRVE